MAENTQEKLTLLALAGMVRQADGFNRRSSKEQIAHILEIALKQKVGMASLSGAVYIDLGNGYLLNCVAIGGRT